MSNNHDDVASTATEDNAFTTNGGFSDSGGSGDIHKTSKLKRKFRKSYGDRSP